MEDQDRKGAVEPDPDKGEGSKGAANPDSKTATVPLSVLEALRADFKAQIAQLRKENGTLKAGQPKSETAPVPEQVFTRAQLKVAVIEGKITEDQMDALLEKQTRAEIKKEIETAVGRTASVARASATVETELGRYIEAHPDLVDESSDLRAKVQAEFDYLLALGDDPESRATQLKAVRAAVGPLNTNRGRKKEPEPHQETGGAGEDGKARGAGADALFKGVSPKLKAHYEKMISRGFYKGAAGEKALKAELASARRPN